MKVIRRLVGAIIVDKRGQFLLQKKTMDYEHFSGQWGLFGGAIEEGETEKEAIKREVLEEIGIEFENFIFFEKQNYSLKEMEVEEFIFAVEFNKKMNEIKLEEGAGFAFFDKLELENLNLFHGARRILEKYLSN